MKRHLSLPMDAPPSPELLPQPIVGYAADKAQREALIAYGIPPAMIWTLGDGAESLDSALGKFRELRGTVVIAGIGKVLGDTKRDVIAAARKIELRAARIVDIADAATKTLSDAIDRALSFVAGAARMRSKRFAKRIGQRGGFGKGIAAQAARDNDVPCWLVRNIVNAIEIPWAVKMRLLEDRFSQSTLRRRYAEQT